MRQLPELKMVIATEYGVDFKETNKRLMEIVNSKSDSQGEGGVAFVATGRQPLQRGSTIKQSGIEMLLGMSDAVMSERRAITATIISFNLPA